MNVCDKVAKVAERRGRGLFQYTVTVFARRELSHDSLIVGLESTLLSPEYKAGLLHKISVSHGGEYEDDCLLGCCVV
jgi:hypothetical protein